MGYRNYSVANGLIVDKLGNGDFTTIQAAINAASSGQTVFVRPGTYTENPTLKSGVDLVSFVTDSDIPNVIINGTCSFTSAGTVGISGVMLQTNGNFALAVTGSAASNVYINDCYINCLNNTGIQFTSSNSQSNIIISDCQGNIETTGITYHSCSTAGSLQYFYCNMGNSGNSSTASTFASSGFFALNYSPNFLCPLSFSGTALFNISYSRVNTGPTNTTPLATTSTGNLQALYTVQLNGGTASALSIGVGASLICDVIDINSSNTNAITGSGTINYGLIVYTGTSSTNNVSTQTAFATQPSLGNSGTITQFNTLVGGASGAIASVSPGTAGQVLTSNGASSNPSYKGGGWTLISTLTASNSATISFTSIGTFNNYVFVLSNVTPASNSTVLGLVVSTNGGSSYLNSGYQAGIWSYQYTATSFGGATGVNSTSTFPIFDVFGSATNSGSGQIFISDVTSGAPIKINGHGCLINTSNAYLLSFVGQNTNTGINAFQFAMSSGNITSGSFSLYGINS